MNTERINEEAKAFQKENCCFIHVECDDGRQEAVITGDGNAVIKSLASIVGSLAEGCNTSVVNVLTNILHNHLMMKKAIEEGVSRKEAQIYSFPKMKKPDEE